MSYCRVLLLQAQWDVFSSTTAARWTRSCSLLTIPNTVSTKFYCHFTSHALSTKRTPHVGSCPPILAAWTANPWFPTGKSGLSIIHSTHYMVNYPYCNVGCIRQSSIRTLFNLPNPFYTQKRVRINTTALIAALLVWFYSKRLVGVNYACCLYDKASILLPASFTTARCLSYSVDAL